jgi:hypothetical protein
MRKQLHEVAAIEEYVFKRMTAPDRFLFEAKMIIDPELQQNVTLQEKVYAMIRWFGRKTRKEQLEQHFNNAMRDPKFATTIRSIFQ